MLKLSRTVAQQCAWLGIMARWHETPPDLKGATLYIYPSILDAIFKVVTQQKGHVCSCACGGCRVVFSGILCARLLHLQ